MAETTIKATHTPGPWEPRVEDGQLFVSATETRLAPLWSGDGPGATCDTTKNVAIVCKYQIGEAREANAHLIAAAPEMYEALMALYQGFIEGSIKFTKKRQADSDPYHPANTLMTAAIAKAEGRNA